ncbi:hypothetical protein F3Y22_tig00110160pilonHSYRG00172 [Hibiscus syriacus]|uniref:RING-CH-type domain-containing protein n=1 Tax=Hibiscus syriacus TaxID=106335 RepID=A0A6A3BHP6_HIBSY|nr:hypothetical protein F3Y22_tig00110160pilonHSYRG00172 [Hibiscus syriacus]
MEALPKQTQGVVVVIGIDDGGGGEQENQTDNDEDIRRCSLSCSNEEKSGTNDERGSSVSLLEVELEAGTKLHLENVERNCRICHLSLDTSNQECDLPIELRCCCKDDLVAAHKQCVWAWFKIKGNK